MITTAYKEIGIQTFGPLGNVDRTTLMNRGGRRGFKEKQNRKSCKIYPTQPCISVFHPLDKAFCDNTQKRLSGLKYTDTEHKSRTR